MKIRFIYHKGKDSWVGRGIVVWTWILALVRCDFKSLKFNFSHVEIWFPDEKYPNYYNGFGGQDDWSTMIHKAKRHSWYGQCFSSTTRGDAEGVRFAPAAEVLHHPGRWMYQEYEVTAEGVVLMMPWFKDMVGRKYDYAGLFGFFLPWNPQKEDREYCSELSAWVAWSLKILRKRHKRISPRRLAKVLGGELKSLV